MSATHGTYTLNTHAKRRGQRPTYTVTCECGEWESPVCRSKTGAIGQWNNHVRHEAKEAS